MLDERWIRSLHVDLGTMVGFRFPAYAEGIEVSGYHLHFVDEACERGGHVLDSRAAGPLRVGLDCSSELHVELPPGVELGDPGVAAATHKALAPSRAHRLIDGPGGQTESARRSASQRSQRLSP